SPRRSYARQYMFNARNHVLFAWYHAPWSFLPAQCLGSNVLDLRNAIPKRSVLAVLRGIARGYGAALRDWRLRAPVRLTLYRFFRATRQPPGRPIEEVGSADGVRLGD